MIFVRSRRSINTQSRTLEKSNRRKQRCFRDEEHHPRSKQCVGRNNKFSALVEGFESGSGVLSGEVCVSVQLHAEADKQIISIRNEARYHGDLSARHVSQRDASSRTRVVTTPFTVINRCIRGPYTFIFFFCCWPEEAINRKYENLANDVARKRAYASRFNLISRGRFYCRAKLLRKSLFLQPRAKLLLQEPDRY